MTATKSGAGQRETRAIPSTEQDTANPPQQDIAKLAYALWQQRGCPEGSAEYDWIEAERELSSSRG